MTTTINTTTVLKAFLDKTPNRNWQMVGHFQKLSTTPGIPGTNVQVWYDPVSDVLYADPTFDTAATQNPNIDPSRN